MKIDRAKNETECRITATNTYWLSKPFDGETCKWAPKRKWVTESFERHSISDAYEAKRNW